MSNKNIKVKLISGIILLAGAASALFAAGEKDTMEGEMKSEMESSVKSEYALEGVETAVFAGGCFWGIEGVFEMLEGVEDVVSGYSGGSADTAFYKMVGTGATGHAEAVRIVYDPQYISYETLLDVFFSVAHDPTQFNYQGPDVGTEYRSAVFYLDETQKMKTEIHIKQLEKDKVYKQPIVTEVTPLDAFYPAEDYHQDFMKLNPEHPYIVYWDIPKVKDLENHFPELIAEE